MYVMVCVQEQRLVLLNAAVFFDVVTCNVAEVGGCLRGFFYFHKQGAAYFFN